MSLSSFQRAHSSRQAGFTLIELLVSITILLVITGGGIAAYLNFSTKEKVVQAGRDVLFLTRAAQKKARVGDKPAGCTRLQSYEFQVQSASQINLRAICDSGAYQTQSLTLPAGITINTGGTVRFFVLHGGASSNQNYTVTDGTTRFTFTIGTGGDITEGAIQ